MKRAAQLRRDAEPFISRRSARVSIFATRETKTHRQLRELRLNSRKNAPTNLARRLQCNAACGILLTDWMAIGIE